MSTAERHARRRAIATALFVTVLWSSSWILIRVGVDDESLPPLTFAAMRYSAAAGGLAGWVLAQPSTRSELRSLRADQWRALAALGLIYYAVTQGAQFVAIAHQPAATASLMLAPTPFLVAVLSQRSIGETVSRRQVAGAGLIIVGAVVFFAGDLGATVVGMTASVIKLGANVTSSLLGRSMNRSQHLSPLTVTVASMTIGAAALAATGLMVDGVPRVTPTAAAIVVWLAVVNTAWAFTLWNSSLRYLTAVESASINGTMLIQIAVLAWLFLGESPGLIGALGIAIVSSGALLAQRGTATTTRRPIGTPRTTAGRASQQPPQP